MSFSNTAENAIMGALYNGTPWANILDNAASSPITTIANALHTADPGEAGNLSTSEATYTSYTRKDVNRNSGGWTVSGSNVNPVAAIEFPAATGGNENLGYWSTGKPGGGGALIILTGTITPAVNATNGVTPRMTPATTLSMD